jgi:hypothetical protein
MDVPSDAHPLMWVSLGVAAEEEDFGSIGNNLQLENLA